MDSNMKELEAKYWAGETSLEEEQALRGYANTLGADVSEGLKQLFSMSAEVVGAELDPLFEAAFWDKVEDQDSEEPTEAKVIPFNVGGFLKYAAVGIIAVMLAFAAGNFILNFDNKPTESTMYASAEDTFEDPELAYQEMRKALLFASQKLNKGSAPLSELKKFDDGMNAAQASVVKN